jgi:putative transposase
VIVEYIDAHRSRWGVEPICTVLTREADIKIAPGTYYARKTRPVSARAQRDTELKEEIMRIHSHPKTHVYGVRKIHAQLGRDGIQVARCTVERLCSDLGVRGVSRRRSHPKTTVAGSASQRPVDLVNRSFTATAPNQLWVADLTYVATTAGWVYVAFVLDVFSRMIVGWQASTRMFTDLALDALTMGIFARKRAGQDVTGLIHHSDRGAQYRAVRYTDRLAEAGAVASVGAKGDSYDNAMAESLNSLYKAEVITQAPGWEGLDDVETATADWVGWFNHERLHSMLDYRTPTEVEAQYWAGHTGPDQTATAA